MTTRNIIKLIEGVLVTIGLLLMPSGTLNIGNNIWTYLAVIFAVCFVLSFFKKTPNK